MISLERGHVESREGCLVVHIEGSVDQPDEQQQKCVFEFDCCVTRTSQGPLMPCQCQEPVAGVPGV